MRVATPAPLIVLAVAAMLVAGCRSGSTDDTPADGVDSTAALTALVKYDKSTPLLVEGRDRLRACVQILDNAAPADEAAAAIREALVAAVDDYQWPASFGTPQVDVECPLPPVALDTSERMAKRAICREEVGPYLVHAFVADESSLTERFPEGFVQNTRGIRKASHEQLLVNDFCEGVSEAWYLTAEQLDDPDLLQRFIFGPLGIFTIADFRRED